MAGRAKHLAGQPPATEVQPRELAPGETLAPGPAPEGVEERSIPAPVPPGDEQAPAQAPDEVGTPAVAPEAGNAVPVSEMSGGVRMTELGPRPAGNVLGGASDGKPVGEVQAPAPLSADAAVHRPIEPGYVHPEMRGNADYRAAQQEQEAKNLAAGRSGWGLDRNVKIIGASPNMAKHSVNTVF
jgi:hypothetical protein